MPGKEAAKNDSRGALADVRALAKVLRQYELSEIELTRMGETIRICRSAPVAATVTVPEASVQPRVVSMEAAAADSRPSGPTDSAEVITSPFVGTFYVAPSPDADPFVTLGQSVKRGTTLCIVEAMKLMNEIEAEHDMKIIELLVNNGEAVEFGQPLFRIETTAA